MCSENKLFLRKRFRKYEKDEYNLSKIQNC